MSFTFARGYGRTSLEALGPVGMVTRISMSGFSRERRRETEVKESKVYLRCHESFGKNRQRRIYGHQENTNDLVHYKA